ncbi:MAG: DNA mismatch repair endonuclease MutL [Planctomycetes bacterium]|nr:DNA mismatch repair endonuclease MutL [Planctomycetota bacterium]
MGVIRVLPPNLVNRIAAGECVERPSSVVKELVENALDSGAAQIDISILDGGRELIAVRDDGQGMNPDDLLLAVHPHATSKIAADDDLFNIHTMGFRGEALASIGSVSRLAITSRSAEADVAHIIRVEGGVQDDPRPCAAPVGTLVEVRDLFYAVPARRKFLKTPATEVGHITEQLARIALAHPGIGFTLRNQNRLVHDLRSTDARLERIADFFGSEVAEVLLPISRESGGVRVEGLVAPPKDSRGSSKWEYVFVNGRYVRDRFVSHAVKEAYRSLIDPSRYPMVFLYITVDPSHVDVNVHPTKIEVRWRDSNFVHGQVLAALRDKFLKTNLDHRFRAPAENEEYRERVRGAMVDFFTRHADAERPVAVQQSVHSGTRPQPFAGSRASESAVREITPVDEPAAVTCPAPAPAAEVERAPNAAANLAGAVPVRAIQVHNTYLVVEQPDGVLIIDQHALHERILYETLKRRIADRKLESQRLLLPEVIRVPSDRHEVIESHADTLARLGVEIVVSGPSSVALHAFPSFLERLDRTAFLRDLIDRLAEPGARPAADTLLHEILDMMACKAAVKAGDPLTPEEIAALLAQRELADRSSHCPHGRPTTLHLSLRDLEKQFHRR